MKYILFDLDGTLTDPFLGITKAVCKGLETLGIEENDLNKLKPFIGPPLEETYQHYYHLSLDECHKAIAAFSRYYDKQGKFENTVYPKTKTLLKELNNRGYGLYICSGKPTVFISDILSHFHLTDYFKGFYGSMLDGGHTSKDEVINDCLVCENLDYHDGIMVGDRKDDVIGAHKNKMSCIGVLYGYGSQTELRLAQCDYIVETMDELLTMIDEID